MSESSLQIAAALTVFFVGLLSWVLIIYLNYRLSKKVSALVKGKTALVFLFTGVFSLVFACIQFFVLNSVAKLFTGFGLGYAVGFGAGACALGAVGSALISTYLIKSGHRSKVALHGQDLSS